MAFVIKFRKTSSNCARLASNCGGKIITQLSHDRYAVCLQIGVKHCEDLSSEFVYIYPCSSMKTFLVHRANALDDFAGAMCAADHAFNAATHFLEI